MYCACADILPEPENISAAALRLLSGFRLLTGTGMIQSHIITAAPADRRQRRQLFSIKFVYTS